MNLGIVGAGLIMVFFVITMAQVKNLKQWITFSLFVVGVWMLTTWVKSDREMTAAEFAPVKTVITPAKNHVYENVIVKGITPKPVYQYDGEFFFQLTGEKFTSALGKFIGMNPDLQLTGIKGLHNSPNYRGLFGGNPKDNRLVGYYVSFE